MEVTFIDHYDSFSYNLIDWLGQADSAVKITCIAKDDHKSLRFLKLHPTPLVLSPGPGHPGDEKETLDLIEKVVDKVPILGVCLGHQMLGLIAGGSVVPSSAPRHGACRTLTVAKETRLLSGLSVNKAMAAYNSLVLNHLPESDWIVTARCEVGEIQAIEKQGHAWITAGIQFHPESHLSDHSLEIAKRWIHAAKSWDQET